MAEQPRRDDSKKNGPQFDWVSQRSACTLPKVFHTLRLQVEEDVNTRNAQRPENSPYSFSVAEDIHDFAVVLQSGEVREKVTFSLTEDAILVRSDRGEHKLSVTLHFNDHGECKLRVGEEEREYWQVRRMALEDLFFPTIRRPIVEETSNVANRTSAAA